MITLTITLTSAGSDTGPFNLFSNTDGYSSPFETGVAKVDLLAGYTSYVVPDGTTVVRVCSTGTCKNCVDIPVNTTTTTTSTVSASTEINIINNSEDVTIGNILMNSFSLPPGPGLYPNPGDTYLTSYPSGSYSVTVTLYNVPNNNTTVRIDDGDLISCFTYPAGVSVSHTFTVSLTGLATTIQVNTTPC